MLIHFAIKFEPFQDLLQRQHTQTVSSVNIHWWSVSAFRIRYRPIQSSSKVRETVLGQQEMECPPIRSSWRYERQFSANNKTPNRKKSQVAERDCSLATNSSCCWEVLNTTTLSLSTIHIIIEITSCEHGSLSLGTYDAQTSCIPPKRSQDGIPLKAGMGNSTCAPGAYPVQTTDHRILRAFSSLFTSTSVADPRLLDPRVCGHKT